MWGCKQHLSDDIRAGFTFAPHPHDRKPDEIWFYKSGDELMLAIRIGCLTGSFPVKAKELNVVKKFLRRYH